MRDSDRTEDLSNPELRELLRDDFAQAASDAARAVDPLERDDLYRLVIEYLSGTLAIVFIGLILFSVLILPKGNLSPVEWVGFVGLLVGLPAHLPLFAQARKLSKEGLRDFMFRIIFMNSFLLTAIIYLCGTYTAIVAVFLFSQLGMATVMLEPRQVRIVATASFFEFAALVLLQMFQILPRETAALDLFNFEKGPLQAGALILLIGGVMYAIYHWSNQVRRRLEEARRELALLAVTDRLTGLPNRRSFDEALQREVARAQRTNRPLALLMCDADNFKSVNDRFGHAMGDEVLKRIAAVILGSVRMGVDTPARFGGEEFSILLSDTDLEKAKEVAKRMVEAMRHLRFQHGGEQFRVTVSIGVTALSGDELDPDVLLEAADNLLYRAKKEGRDQVIAGSLRDLVGGGG